MNLALQAAQEINALWLACTNMVNVISGGCPTDKDVAEIIRKYFTNQPGPDEEQPE